MLEILRSHLNTLSFDFEAAVRDHVKALTEHRGTIGVPAPIAHPIVDAAVARHRVDGTPYSYAADYTIIEDIKPPTLAERKDALEKGLRAYAVALEEQLMPRRKRELFVLRAQEAYNTPADARIEAHNAAIADHEKHTERMRAIARHLAEQVSEVEDLTDETIKAWKPKDFPT